MFLILENWTAFFFYHVDDFKTWFRFFFIDFLDFLKIFSWYFWIFLLLFLLCFLFRIFLDFWILEFFWIVSDFFVVDFLLLLCLCLILFFYSLIFLWTFWIPFKVNEATTKIYQGYHWTPKMAYNWPKEHGKFFIARRAKKPPAEGQSPPQKLKVGLRSGLYLQVLVIWVLVCK